MKRVLTAAIGVPLVVGATLYAPDWLFALITAAVSALALEEFLALSAARGLGRPGRWILFLGGAVTASFVLGASRVLLTSVVTVLVLMTTAVFGKPIESAIGRVASGLGGVFYCCFLMGFILLLSPYSLVTLFAIVWVGDSTAYYCGRAFGRRPLAPRVSPRKTIEGAIAGILGSIGAGLVMFPWLLGESWPAAAMISGLAAAAGQIGDLAESVLKRSAGVKDSSSILPGHGGILDRLDSLLFAAPVFYYLLQVTSA
jgi:phosphatidate cytidylyltransferase